MRGSSSHERAYGLLSITERPSSLLFNNSYNNLEESPLSSSNFRGLGVSPKKVRKTFQRMDTGTECKAFLRCVTLSHVDATDQNNWLVESSLRRGSDYAAIQDSFATSHPLSLQSSDSPTLTNSDAANYSSLFDSNRVKMRPHHYDNKMSKSEHKILRKKHYSIPGDANFVHTEISDPVSLPRPLVTANIEQSLFPFLGLPPRISHSEKKQMPSSHSSGMPQGKDMLGLPPEAPKALRSTLHSSGANSGFSGFHSSDGGKKRSQNSLIGSIDSKNKSYHKNHSFSRASSIFDFRPKDDEYEKILEAARRASTFGFAREFSMRFTSLSNGKFDNYQSNTTSTSIMIPGNRKISELSHEKSLFTSANIEKSKGKVHVDREKKPLYSNTLRQKKNLLQNSPASFSSRPACPTTVISTGESLKQKPKFSTSFIDKYNYNKDKSKLGTNSKIKSSTCKLMDNASGSRDISTHNHTNPASIKSIRMNVPPYANFHLPVESFVRTEEALLSSGRVHNTGPKNKTNGQSKPLSSLTLSPNFYLNRLDDSILSSSSDSISLSSFSSAMDFESDLTESQQSQHLLSKKFQGPKSQNILLSQFVEGGKKGYFPPTINNQLAAHGEISSESANARVIVKGMEDSELRMPPCSNSNWQKSRQGTLQNLTAAALLPKNFASSSSLPIYSVDKYEKKGLMNSEFSDEKKFANKEVSHLSYKESKNLGNSINIPNNNANDSYSFGSRLDESNIRNSLNLRSKRSKNSQSCTEPHLQAISVLKPTSVLSHDFSIPKKSKEKEECQNSMKTSLTEPIYIPNTDHTQQKLASSDFCSCDIM